MMNALASPVEPLAFNYLSYGLLTAVTNLWVWAVTAALNVWRIGASSPPQSGSKSAEQRAVRSKDDASPSERVEEVKVSPPARVRSAPDPAASGHVLERENSTKGKFVLYYGGERDDVVEEGNEGHGGEEESCAVEEFDRWFCEDWKRPMVVRMGDMGWCRYQDLSVLDGSVVRLWDGCRRRTVT